jgi:hypothetical protein
MKEKMEGYMAYNQDLAQRIRDILGETSGLIEKQMFGGIGFMIQGNMACGVNKDDLIIRVGSDQYDNALTEAHTRVFDMTGRPMRGWIVVTVKGYEASSDLKDWVERGVSFAKSLPPK